jgi:hypothetical protein
MLLVLKRVIRVKIIYTFYIASIGFIYIYIYIYIYILLRIRLYIESLKNNVQKGPIYKLIIQTLHRTQTLWDKTT